MHTLVYVEPTAAGAWAVDLARAIVAGTGGKLVLLTSEESLSRRPGLLEETRARLGDIPGVTVETRSRTGRPREAIIAEATATFPALTVIPPAGRRGFARLLRGSRVRAVVGRMASTVMVARRPVHERVRSVLVAFGGGPMSEATVLGAIELARALGASITLLHVSSDVSLPRVSATGESAGELAERLWKLAADAGLDAAVRLRDGMVVPEVIAECLQGGHDLLIIGQHRIAPEAGGALAENLAVDLADQSPIPVLVVRPRQESSGTP